MERASRWGVDWFIHRLAFAEFTRAPFETHLNRSVPAILADHAALDAMETLAEMEREEARAAK